MNEQEQKVLLALQEIIDDLTKEQEVFEATGSPVAYTTFTITENYSSYINYTKAIKADLIRVIHTRLFG